MFDPKFLAQLSEQKDRWEATTLNKAIVNKPERRERFMTESSRDIDRLYTPRSIFQNLII